MATTDDYQRKTYYELLGVSSDAPRDQIARAYREIAKVYHPDSNFFDDIIQTPLTERDKELFRRITEAYETLNDREKRAAYDASLKSATPSPPAQPRDDMGTQAPPSMKPPTPPAPTEEPVQAPPSKKGWLIVFVGVVVPVGVALVVILKILFGRP